MTAILVTKASTVLQATASHPHWVSFSFFMRVSLWDSACAHKQAGPGLRKGDQ